jgi:hypothetical protein
MFQRLLLMMLDLLVALLVRDWNLTFGRLIQSLFVGVDKEFALFV